MQSSSMDVQAFTIFIILLCPTMPQGLIAAQDKNKQGNLHAQGGHLAVTLSTCDVAKQR